MLQKNFDGELTYEYKILLDKKEKLEARQNLPITEKLPMFEQYPERITRIELANFLIK